MPTSHHKVALALVKFGSSVPAQALAQTRTRIYHTQGGPLHMAEPLGTSKNEKNPKNFTGCFW